MGECGKSSREPLVAKRAQLLDRCALCSEVPGQCIIGPELTGVRAWSVVGPSIQVCEGDKRPRHKRWTVAVFVWGVTLDRRYPLATFRHLDNALASAFDRAKHLTGGPIEAWGEDYMAGPVPGRRVLILVNRR